MHTSGGGLSEIESTIAHTQPMIAQVAATIASTQSVLLQFGPANAHIRWSSYAPVIVGVLPLDLQQY